MLYMVIAPPIVPEFYLELPIFQIKKNVVLLFENQNRKIEEKKYDRKKK
jgi:hypothetical protein